MRAYMRVCAPRRTSASPGFSLDDVAVEDQLRAVELPVTSPGEEITLISEVRLFIPLINSR